MRHESWDDAFWHHWLTHSVEEAERLADMTNPRDSQPQLAVAINYETGARITDRQQVHLDAIREAGDRLLMAMHDAEGSGPPGEHQEHIFQTRRMKIAHTHIETALMFARRAALETK